MRASGRYLRRVPVAAGRDAVSHRVSLQRSEGRERSVAVPSGSLSGAEPRLRAAVVPESAGAGHVTSYALYVTVKTNVFLVNLCFLSKSTNLRSLKEYLTETVHY